MANAQDEKDPTLARYHHDWGSADYVAGWADGQDKKEAARQEAFGVLARTIPFGQNDPIRILDVGSGYGALAKFLLEHFPKATAVCQDGSAEMANLGRERMGNNLARRFDYVIANFSEPGWTKEIPDKFDAVVSSIAIHNVRSPDVVRRIFEDVYALVKPGGCFLDFDRPRPSWEEQLEFMRGAGFQDVKIFWQGEMRAVFGGFRK